MLKKFSILFLLTLLLLQAGGILLCYMAEQKLVRYEMKEKLENENAVFEKLILSKKDYNAAKRAHNELAFDQKLFDIKSKTFIGDSVHLLVINDTKEKQIEHKIEAYFAEDENPNSDQAKQIKKIFESHYLCPTQNEWRLANSWKYISYPEWDTTLLPINLNTTSPPPQLV